MNINKNKVTRDQGFTLIEVAVAITILGIGLATLMASTTRLMDTTYQEIKRSQANIYASYILEVALNRQMNTSAQSPIAGSGSGSSNLPGFAKSNLPFGAQSGSLREKLTQEGYLDGIQSDELSIDVDDTWSYELRVDPLEIDLLPVTPQQITVTIIWGNENHERYSLQTIRLPNDGIVPNQENNEEDVS